MESLTFNFTTKTLTVNFTDGTSKEYSNKEEYLKDYPEREADVIAIGW